MQAEGFIARRLRVKEKMAVTAIAISFFVIIIAVAISAGFRREIRGGVSAVTGDVLLTNSTADLTGGADPVRTPARLQDLAGVRGVERIEPVVYSAGILRLGDDIQGAMFKGTAADTVSMGVRIPATLAGRFGRSEYGLSKKDLIHIGDSIGADLLGARKAGIAALPVARKNRLGRLVNRS